MSIPIPERGKADPNSAITESDYSACVDVGGSGLSASKVDDILAIPKGERPDPSTYLSEEQIAMHLSLFDGGAIRITTTEAIDRFGTAGPQGGFAMPQPTFDRLIRCSGDAFSAIEEALGLTSGSLSPGEAVAAQIDAEDFDNIRVPSGNEDGVTAWWLPGGYTAGGVPEAVMDLSSVPFTVLALVRSDIVSDVSSQTFVPGAAEVDSSMVEFGKKILARGASERSDDLIEGSCWSVERNDTECVFEYVSGGHGGGLGRQVVTEEDFESIKAGDMTDHDLMQKYGLS